MIYDYVVTKPPLNEDTLTHYGVKGMKWRKKRKSFKDLYYEKKSKIAEIKAEREASGMNPEKTVYASWLIRDKNKQYRDPKTPNKSGYSYGDSKTRSGYPHSRNDHAETGSNIERGLEAGRERTKKRKK